MYKPFFCSKSYNNQDCFLPLCSLRGIREKLFKENIAEALYVWILCMFIIYHIRKKLSRISYCTQLFNLFQYLALGYIIFLQYNFTYHLIWILNLRFLTLDTWESIKRSCFFNRILLQVAIFLHLRNVLH